MVDYPPQDVILIAGAGHGGWAWDRVRPILEGKGHRVFSPTLAGIGEKRHMLTADIRLATHVQEFCSLFENEKIANAILVGHSYAGWVISAAAEKLEQKLAAIAFVDAFLPENGQCGLDFLNPQQKLDFEGASARGELSRPGPTSAGLRIQSNNDAVWVDQMISQQPLGVSLDRVHLTGARERIARKLYIRTPLFPSPNFDTALAKCVNDPSWQTIIMEGCGHDPMIDKPHELASHLIELSQSARTA